MPIIPAGSPLPATQRDGVTPLRSGYCENYPSGFSAGVAVIRNGHEHIEPDNVRSV